MQAGRETRKACCVRSTTGHADDYRATHRIAAIDEGVCDARPAPLVESEASAAELLRKAHEEIEDVDAKLRRWEKGVGAAAAARAPFDLDVQPAAE